MSAAIHAMRLAGMSTEAIAQQVGMSARHVRRILSKPDPDALQFATPEHAKRAAEILSICPLKDPNAPRTYANADLASLTEDASEELGWLLHQGRYATRS